MEKLKNTQTFSRTFDSSKRLRSASADLKGRLALNTSFSLSRSASADLERRRVKQGLKNTLAEVNFTRSDYVNIADSKKILAVEDLNGSDSGSEGSEGSEDTMVSRFLRNESDAGSEESEATMIPENLVVENELFDVENVSI